MSDLTVEYVRAEVEFIERVKADNEGAHGHEDALHENVLRAVADGHPDSALLASEALKTLSVDFERWYA